MRQIVLLRGINLGARNRVSMPELREQLAEAGFGDARTYLQSGNIVLSSKDRPAKLAKRFHTLIAEGFGLDIEVIVRTRDELNAVVRRNPLKDVADNPKRYQVTFLSAPLSPDRLNKLADLAAGDERFVADGRELYAWHPEGVARSKLWNQLAGSGLGVAATARNWTTVTSLLQMADDG
jgi:uncharacterized protein (DUF1697 family)